MTIVSQVLILLLVSRALIKNNDIITDQTTNGLEFWRLKLDCLKI